MKNNLIALSEDLRSCQDLESFWSRTCTELSKFGVKSALYAAAAFQTEINTKHLTRSLFIKTNHSREFIETFGQESIVDDEYTSQRCVFDLHPTLWHNEDEWDYATPAQRMRARMERDMGYHVGITIPAPNFAPGHVGGLGLSTPELNPDQFNKMWPHVAEHVFAIAAMLDSGMRKQHLREIILLSPREKEVLTHLAAGTRPGEIADRLHISTKTIEHYVRGSKRKLKAGTRDSAVAKALLFNIIHP